MVGFRSAVRVWIAVGLWAVGVGASATPEEMSRLSNAALAEIAQEARQRGDWALHAQLQEEMMRRAAAATERPSAALDQ